MEYEALHGIPWDKGTFWVTVAVLIFLFIFGRKIVGFVVKILDDRSTAIRSQIDEAMRLRAEAESMLKDAEARKNEVLAQAQEIVSAASREAEQLAAALIAEASAAAKRHQQMIEEQIVAARKAAIEAIQQKAVSLAVRATEIILRQTVEADESRKIIDSSIASIPETFYRPGAR